MRRIRQWTLNMVLIFTGLTAQQAGDIATDFSLSNSNGTQFSLSQYSGKIILLFTLGNTCSSCIAGGAQIEVLVQEFAVSGQLAALGLDFWDASSSVTTIQSFIQKTGITFPVLLKAGSLASAYATTYDRLIVVAPDGSFAFKGNRSASQDIEETRQVIQSLLNTARGPRSADKPSDFHLSQNVPNPFNPGTRFHYSLTRDSQVTLSVYSLLGSKLDVLVDEFQTQGDHSLLYEPRDLPGGVYFYQLRVDGHAVTKKMILQ